MSEHLDESYLKWLYAHVGSVRRRDPTKTYWSLLRQLYTKEFVWIIPNDDNRIEDGKDLRYRFVTDTNIKDADPLWMELGCSMLEMFVALSLRLSFEYEREPRDWFWEMMENLGLDQFTDWAYMQGDCTRSVDEVLDRIIWRTYEPDGSGGIFPLRYPEEDQTDLEIWYQMNAYLLEML